MLLSGKHFYPNGFLKIKINHSTPVAIIQARVYLLQVGADS
jgi:hypothetical protein